MGTTLTMVDLILVRGSYSIRRFPGPSLRRGIILRVSFSERLPRCRPSRIRAGSAGCVLERALGVFGTSSGNSFSSRGIFEVFAFADSSVGYDRKAFRFALPMKGFEFVV